MADLEPEVDSARPFYVVSHDKFVMLFLATMGIYSLYWFYRHWMNYKLHSGRNLWPLPRAVFSIFFTHALFARFYQQARKRDPELQWRHGLYATVYVVFSIVFNLADSLTSFGVDVVLGTLLGLAAIFVVYWALARAQQVANLACGDPEGSANRHLGAANIAWIVLGLLFWLLFFVSLAAMLGPLPWLETA